MSFRRIEYANSAFKDAVNAPQIPITLVINAQVAFFYNQNHCFDGTTLFVLLFIIARFCSMMLHVYNQIYKQLC